MNKNNLDSFEGLKQNTTNTNNFFLAEEMLSLQTTGVKCAKQNKAFFTLP